MQFKKVGNRIQVLAYRGYDKEKKRAIIKMLGSLNAYSYRPSDGLTDDMTDEEKEELQTYIKESRQADDNYMLQSATERLDSNIKKVSDSLAEDNHYMTDEISVRLYDAMSDLQKSMRRAGFKRPAAAKKAVKKVDTKTRSLPLK